MPRTVPELKELNRTPSIQGVDRALSVLSLFASAETATLGITEIAQALGLSKAVVHRILSAFRVKGFVDMDADTHRYRLGTRVLALGQSYLDRIELLPAARKAMAALVEQSRETATLWIRLGWECVVVEQLTPEREIKLVGQLGLRTPLHLGATAKSLLAFMPEDEVAEYLQTVAADAPEHGSGLLKSLRSELARIRTRGYAVSLGERTDDVGVIAAPIRTSSADPPLGALSISGPIERIADHLDRWRDVLLLATEDVGSELRHPESELGEH